MRWQARYAWGACAAAVTATTFGCEMFAPLDGLSGADAGRTPPWMMPAAGDDASTPAAEGGEPDETGATEGSSGPDAADAASPLVDAADAQVEADAGIDESPPPVPIAFVQVATAAPAGVVSSVSATFAQQQSHGDLNVVAIGWNDASSNISTVSDTSGNTYALALGPTRISPDLTQSLYYAKNIARAGVASNVVTVAFTKTANVTDLRVVEYSGLDVAAPFVAAASGSGNDAGPAASSMVMTTAAPSLLFAAGMTTNTYSAPGPGYAMRVVTSLGDLVEDRIVTSPGSYDAQASLGASCEWVLQVAAFH